MIISAQEIKLLSKISNSFYDDFKTEFLYHSNHMEGSTFSKENIEQLLETKKVYGTHDYQDIVETKNSLDVFDEMINSIDEPLDKLYILHLHRILKRGTADEEIGLAGNWKKFENRLKGVELKVAAPHEVESRMFNLLADWHESGQTLEDIARFHAGFEHIHPFQDGNGRIGRFIMVRQCIDAEVDLIAIDEEYEADYKAALYRAQTDAEYGNLVCVFKQCQERLDEKLSCYHEMLEQVKVEAQVEDFMEEVEEPSISI